MKFLPFCLVFMGILLSNPFSQARIYHPDDKEVLRSFLRQGVEGSSWKNLQQLNLSPSDTTNWEADETWVDKIAGLTWDGGSPERLTEIAWVNKYLVENFDGKGLSELLSLSCYSNRLSSIDLSGCSHLQSLNCSYNPLSSLDLMGCGRLQSLNCYRNTLFSLNLSGCSRLQSLNCGINALSFLDLSDCVSLRSLFCSYNNLLSLDLNGCNGLRNLYCYYNQDMLSLGVSDRNNLQILECYYNNLSSLDLRGCSSLLQLNCYNNSLSSLDLNSCSSLQNLNCYSNSLSFLDISNCSGLQGLNCAENRLSLSELNIIDQLLRGDQVKVLSPQNSVFFENKTMRIGDELDLSNESEFNGVLTTYILEKDGFFATPDDDFSINNGKIIFYQPGTYTVIIENTTILSYSSHAKITTGMIHVKQGMGIENNAETKIRIYPNPAERELRVKNEELRIKNIVVTDINGWRVYQATPESNEHTIGIEQWPAGTYVIKAVTDSGIVTEKVIKR